MLLKDTLILTCILVFGILLLSNIYFRLQAFRTFKKLAEGGVAFSKAHLMNSTLLEKEVLNRHPEFAILIKKHINSIKLSMKISSLCVLIITICGAILMYNR